MIFEFEPYCDTYFQNTEMKKSLVKKYNKALITWLILYKHWIMLNTDEILFDLKIMIKL